MPAAALAADSLSFANGDTKATFGANDIVRIDGSITYASDCPKPGINDFFYPATDVYLVEAGSEGGELHDVGGGRPNTIVSGASLFTDEVIGLTAPGGKLDDGVYDVVYDTCQDGQYDPGRDTIFHDAVTVDMPFVAPLADGAIGAIKDQARREYYSWLATRFAMNGIFKLADKAINLQCDIGNPIGCAMKKLDYFSGIKERFMALLLSESNHYLAIAEDPPDANYKTLTTVEPPDFPGGHNDSGARERDRGRARPARPRGRAERGAAARGRALPGRAGGGGRRMGARPCSRGAEPRRDAPRRRPLDHRRARRAQEHGRR